MPQRAPLSAIDGNRQKRKDLTPYLRGQIIAKSQAGASQREISKELGLPRTTVQSTLRLQNERTDGQSKPRSGRPAYSTERLLRRIVRFVNANPKKTYAQVLSELNLSFCRATLHNILAPAAIRKWRCAQRPVLTPEIANKRLQWVLARRDWTEEEWKNIIFSDECSVERGFGAQRQWAFHTPQQKWDRACIQTYKKGKDISIMVWGAIWLGGRSDLDIMVRDTTTGGGYTAQSYIDTLEHTMGAWLQPGYIFMQDNASIHTARKVSQWFDQWGIQRLEWPPYSPDLNPIEHVWAKMKESLVKNHPELSEMGQSQEAWDALARAIVEAWDALDQSYIDNLVRSMDNRVNHVVDAKGWHTRY